MEKTAGVTPPDWLDFDLRARYLFLNIQIDFLEQELLVGIFGEGRVATVALSELDHVWAPTSDLLAPWIAMGHLQEVSRPDKFDFSMTTDPRWRGRQVLSMSTDGQLAFDAIFGSSALHHGTVISRTGAGVTPVLPAEWFRGTLRTRVDELPIDSIPMVGATLEVAEIDLVNRVVRLVLSAAGRWLVEFHDVANIRLGPTDGRDMAAEVIGPHGSGATVIEFASESRSDGELEPPAGSWTSIHAGGSFELGVLARSIYVGPRE